MSFLYPLGFLALIGIPVLILIYIIKNRYTEQTIASTYLWTLSEQFLKRRIPINRITGIINLILQILAVILVALILAHPIINLPNAASAYCFILDGSGSMNIVEDDKTRFDVGKEKIAEIIKDSVAGSTYTLIYVGNTTDTVFENFTDKDRAVEIVNDMTVAYKALDFKGALSIAQRYYNEYPYAKTYLITDKNFQKCDNVELINVGSREENYSLSDIDYILNNDGITITGKVLSYVSDATLTLNLYLNNGEQPCATQDIFVQADIPNVNAGDSAETEDDGDVGNDTTGTDFTFNYEGEEVDDFVSLKVEIAQNDALSLDNEVTVFNLNHENIAKTLLVSDTPFFMSVALRAAGHTQVDVIESKDYNSQSGYGLYIFERFIPSEMPREGAVWIINPESNLEGSNFSYQGPETSPKHDAVFSNSSSSVVGNLLKGISKKDFEIPRYQKLGLSGRFTTLISCDGNPILFTGTNKYGNREVVFAFDIKDSAMFLLFADSPVLFANLLSYSFPEVLTSTTYVCGDTLDVNIIAGCTSIRVETPLGNINYPDTSAAITQYELTEVGIYKIYLIMKDDSERLVNVYSALPLDERVPMVKEEAFSITGTSEPVVSELNGIIDNLLIIFIILAVIAVADYGVYCYEQYQLR